MKKQWFRISKLLLRMKTWEINCIYWQMIVALN